MVKKLQKPAPKKATAKKPASAAKVAFTPAAMLDNAQNVRDQAQQIWAAGLAAFSKAQGEGTKVFDALVKEGMSLQKKTTSLAEQKINAVATKMTGMAGDVGAKAGQHWDKLESIFEERVSKALKSLGVPSGADISSLISRIDALSASVGFAPAKKAQAKPAAAKAKAAVKKVAAKTAPVKKAAATQVAAVKKAVAPKKASPVKAAAKAAEKAVAEAKVAVKRAPRQAKAVVAKAVEAAKDAVQA